VDINYSTNFINSLKRLPLDVQQNIRAALKSLKNWPQAQNVVSLKNRTGCRLRVGRCRVIFLVKGRQIFVQEVLKRDGRTYK
jgi:mRNA-degrading endonuclease RelE of RelBE toxin-antitoxin system